MLDPAWFFERLSHLEISFFSGVPDSLLKNICAYISDHTDAEKHIIAANEGNAVSIGMGYYLATGKTPLIYMQNSGLGNAINPILSLADSEVYSIPVLLMIGWRGEPSVNDEPQHKKQGRVTLELLDTIEMPYEVLSPDMDLQMAYNRIKKMVMQAEDQQRPCALVIKKNTFSSYKLQSNQIYKKPLLREQALNAIIKMLQPEDIVVSTTGVASRELFEYREVYKEGHEKDFLTVGGMGHASQIALGVALFRKDRQVFCLDGDGALLMHMGGVAISASTRANNFKHIIFNNSAHDSVGGQPTIGGDIDMQQIARGAGYVWVKRVQTTKDIENAVNEMRGIIGPAFLEVQVKKGFRKDLGRPTIKPIENKRAFMGFVKCDAKRV